MRRMSEMVHRSLSYEVRRVPASSPDFDLVLHVALGVDEAPWGPGSPHPRVAQFRESIRGAPGPGLAFGAYENGRLVGGCAAAASPGASAMVHLGRPGRGEIAADATAATLRRLIDESRPHGLALLEALIAPDDSASASALSAGGFRFLTRLLYLRRRLGVPHAPAARPVALEWVSYTDNALSLFLAAIEGSYVESLDCPELSNLRSTEAVLAGHRAVGEFDPGLWWTVLRDSEPAGVILLSRLSNALAEVVYMGVAGPARGAGVGDALLARAVRSCEEGSFSALLLAVDERNAPARRLYERWRFVQTGVRSAWIATPLATRG